MLEVVLAVVLGLVMTYLVGQALIFSRKEEQMRSELSSLRDRIEGAKGQIEKQIDDLIDDLDEAAENIEERVSPALNIAEMVEMQRGQIVNSLLEWGVQSIASKFGGGQVALAQIENVQEPPSTTSEAWHEKEGAKSAHIAEERNL
jgi:hypothetical protein